jgi:hypothetical protein
MRRVVGGEATSDEGEEEAKSDEKLLKGRGDSRRF